MSMIGTIFQRMHNRIQC